MANLIWYHKELAALSTSVGNRNNQLCGIARHGLIAGLKAEQIVEDILESCGRPRLTEAEVRRAVATSERSLKRARGRVYKMPPPPTAAERRFVRTMIERGAGATFESLKQSAGLEKIGWTEMVSAHIAAILALGRENVRDRRFDFADKFWVGEKNRGDFMTGFDLHHKPILPPPLIIPNAVSGHPAEKKDGSGALTLRGDNCVTATKLLIVEFDALALEDQVAFWSGVIAAKALKVVSLVFSGSKSIHALVEVEGDYLAYRAKVLRLLASSDDPRERCDRAPMHPAALTRLAGAIRPETGLRQELLWTSG